MQTETADRLRDLRLRRRVLLILHAARVRPESGWASGRFLVDIVGGVSPLMETFVDDDHGAGLLRDLVAGGFAEERDDRWKKYQPAGLSFTSYRITHRGVALIEQQIDPDPLVEDDRLRKNRTTRSE